ncbi:hypothetical protein [Methylobacterium sp. A54F]
MPVALQAIRRPIPPARATGSGSLVGWLAAALRRSARARFAEQLDRIERTGRAGAF